ncbi:glycosyltransferase [bacterium]|nr:MAG: glycosyltransferase [bacterium]
MQISVIMPCHNAARWIEAALQSAAKQTFQPLEIIVINDSSTDDSVQIIERSGVPVRLIEANVRNAAAARNLGIEAAHGDWIAFLDADDIWCPNHLEKAAKLLENGDDVAYMANHLLLREDGNTEELSDYLRHDLPTATNLKPELFVECCARGFHFGHSTVLFQRQRLLDVGCFDVKQKRRHDLDLWLRVTRDKSWAYESEVAALYRVDTPGSISKNVVECEYFYLKALLKNRKGFDTPGMTQMIVSSARRLMSLSFVDGQAKDFREARRLAWPHLGAKLRVFYSLAPSARPLFQAGIRLKRRWVWRNHPQPGAATQ